MPVAPVPYTENPTAVAKVLNEEERHDIQKEREQADQRRTDAGIAKFKIELMFTEELSLRKPVRGVLSFWESGAQLHGGGDSIIHFCPGKMKGRNNCQHYIPDPNHGFGILVCPACNTVWNGDEVFGQVLARLTVQGWTEAICDYYRRLDHNCDIVIKYHRRDIRAAMRAKHISDSLADVRSAPKRLKRIYLLSSLLKDLSAGSSLYARILAFVSA